MTHFTHKGESTALDYIFCSMIENGDIEGVIPKNEHDDGIELLIVGTNCTGVVHISENGVERLTLTSKYEDEETFDTAHDIYEVLPVHYGITLRDNGSAFTIAIEAIEKDA